MLIIIIFNHHDQKGLVFTLMGVSMAAIAVTPEKSLAKSKYIDSNNVFYLFIFKHNLNVISYCIECSAGNINSKK